MLGIETPAKQAQRREAEGKAIGAACRHTQRSLEDCYASNPKASKAAIFAGWREMDEYMRENNIPPAAPTLRQDESAQPREEVIEPTPGSASAASGPTPGSVNGNGSAAPNSAPAPTANARPPANR
nr:hypothetical protein [Tepidimonas alkaliphilus]